MFFVNLISRCIVFKGNPKPLEGVHDFFHPLSVIFFPLFLPEDADS